MSPRRLREDWREWGVESDGVRGREERKGATQVYIRTHAHAQTNTQTRSRAESNVPNLSANQLDRHTNRHSEANIQSETGRYSDTNRQLCRE